MLKYCLLILLPLAVWAGRPPAAVFEDVFELGRPNAAFSASTESRNAMKAYLKKKYRQMRDPIPQASTIAAYAAAHERYQNSEEKQYDRVRVENFRKLSSVRMKRLDDQQTSLKKPKRLDIVPREIIKFELSDAMIFSTDADSSSTNQPKHRTKREEQEKRIEPIPREILRFELSDAIVSKRKGKSVNASSTAARRHRRSASPGPRDYVKFELSDAKTSDNYTRASTKVTENLRHPFTSSDSYRRGKVFDEIVERPEASAKKGGASKKEKRESTQPLEEDDVNDMSPEESRRIKIRGKKQKHIANYEDLPLGVQKAIDIAIQENERINGKARDAASETAAVQTTPKYFFGDKKPKTKKPLNTTPKAAEPKYVPSGKISEIEQPLVEDASNGQTGFIPSKPLEPDAGTVPEITDMSNSKTTSLQGIPKAWWSYSNLRRPKRLYHKVPVQPLVVSPQFVNTFKPSAEQSKMHDLSPGYHRQSNLFSPVISSSPSAEIQTDLDRYRTPVSNIPQEVIIKERPKIQYVIKEIPVPVQMKQQRTKITLEPSISISYGKDITSPGTGEHAIDQSYDNPYGPIEVNQYGQRKQPKEPAHSFQSMKIVIPDSKEESRDQKHFYDSNKYEHIVETQPTQPPTQSNEIDTSDGSIAALSALIGQRPSVQLKGLNQLLHMPVPMAHNAQQHRPQDSTAPVTFPETSTPTPKPSRPGYRSVQIEHGPKVFYDDNLYHTVQMNPQLEIPINKEYTPIQEEVSDVPDSDLVGPTAATPSHATYVVGSHKQTVDHHNFNEEAAGHETNAYRHIHIQSTPAPSHGESTLHHYQEQHHHHHHHEPESEHYDDSEGYAFGYRVRDFHTGNDFGHVQNHDNGVTRGEYHILLPDGRVQNVRYTADEKGFHADVTYESVHPSS